MNLKRLRGEIVAVYGTQSAFAKHVRWTDNKVSRLCTGQYKPDTEEVDLIVEALDLNAAKFLDIFLPQKSPNGDTVGQAS